MGERGLSPTVTDIPGQVDFAYILLEHAACRRRSGLPSPPRASPPPSCWPTVSPKPGPAAPPCRPGCWPPPAPPTCGCSARIPWASSTSMPASPLQRERGAGGQIPSPAGRSPWSEPVRLDDGRHHVARRGARARLLPISSAPGTRPTSPPGRSPGCWSMIRRWMPSCCSSRPSARRTTSPTSPAGRSAGKPVVAYKLGRSPYGAELATSHTGALAGSDAAAEAFFRAHGIARVTTLEGLLELPTLLIGRRPMARPHTPSGSPPPPAAAAPWRSIPRRGGDRGARRHSAPPPRRSSTPPHPPPWPAARPYPGRREARARGRRHQRAAGGPGIDLVLSVIGSSRSSSRRMPWPA